MCEETDREGRGLENKWIYVPLLFVIPGGRRYNLNALRLLLLPFVTINAFELSGFMVALQVKSDECM